jgi:transketolase N-terminal domain/subunit
LLSNRHTARALYVTLAEAGFIPKDAISIFLKPHSRLNGHPNCTKVPGVETSTGPLGHGLPVAVGMAKAAQMSGACWRRFVLIDNGELQEGSNWEAAMAAHFRQPRDTTLRRSTSFSKPGRHSVGRVPTVKWRSRETRRLDPGQGDHLGL